MKENFQNYPWVKFVADPNGSESLLQSYVQGTVWGKHQSVVKINFIKEGNANISVI